MEFNKDKLSAYSSASYMVRTTKQVVMLYDGVMKLIQHAKQAIENGDIEARYNNLQKAETIITGLQAVLDFDKGGEVARNLYDYYAGLDSLICNLHRNPDPASCDNIIKNLRTMRAAWAEIDDKVVTGELNENGEVSVQENPTEGVEPTATSSAQQPVENNDDNKNDDGIINAAAITQPLAGDNLAIYLTA